MGGRCQRGVWGGDDPGVLPPAASAVCGDNNRPSEGTEVIDRGGLWRRSFNPGRETHQSTSEVNRPAFRPPSVTDVCWRCQCSAGKHGAPQQGYDIYCIPLSLLFFVLFCLGFLSAVPTSNGHCERKFALLDCLLVYSGHYIIWKALHSKPQLSGECTPLSSSLL